MNTTVHGHTAGTHNTEKAKEIRLSSSGMAWYGSLNDQHQPSECDLDVGGFENGLHYMYTNADLLEISHTTVSRVYC